MNTLHILGTSEKSFNETKSKMKTFKTIILSLAVIFSFTACKDDTPPMGVGTYLGDFYVGDWYDNPLYLSNIVASIENFGDNTINLAMWAVKFTEEMPKIDIYIRGIITEVTKDSVTLSVPQEGIIPTNMKGIPLPQYKVEWLKGSILTTKKYKQLRFSMFCDSNIVHFYGSKVK